MSWLREAVERILAAGLAAPYAAAMAPGSSLDRRFFVLPRGSEAAAAAKAAIQAHAAAELAGGSLPAPLRARLEPVAQGRILGVGTAPYYVVISERAAMMPVQQQSLAHALENMWLMATALGLGKGSGQGRRAVPQDLSKVMRMFMNGGSYHGHRLLEPAAVRLMFKPEWTYDATAKNGDTQGWCAEWGLGVQILKNDPEVGDRLLPTPDSPHWQGHLGEAYGMISNMLFDRRTGDGYIYYCAGMGADPFEHWSDCAPAFFSFDSTIVQAIFANYFRR